MPSCPVLFVGLCTVKLNVTNSSKHIFLVLLLRRLNWRRGEKTGNRSRKDIRSNRKHVKGKVETVVKKEYHNTNGELDKREGRMGWKPFCL